MKNEIFRKSALDKISSLDQMDQTLTVVKPSSFIALIALCLLLVVAVVWGFTGSIPNDVKGSGVLLNIDNIVSVKYSNQGAIKNIFVKAGDEVENGQIIARIERQDLLDQILMYEKKLEGLQQMKETIENSRKSGNSKQDVMKNLYDEGLITQAEYLNSRQTEINADQQISDVSQQIAVLQEEYQSTTQVIARSSGKVLEVPVKKGDFVSPGATIIVMQTRSSDNIYEALVYFPAANGKVIEPGMKIGVVPATVKQEEFGYIQGIITDVSEFPVSSAHLQASLQNEFLAQTFAKMGPLIETKVSLMPDPSTYSGYKWSSSKGPAKKIGIGTICSASVTTSSRHPVELVIPSLKKNLLGVGDEAAGNGQ
jgi:HlyD family secretion protein